MVRLLLCPAQCSPYIATKTLPQTSIPLLKETLLFVALLSTLSNRFMSFSYTVEPKTALSTQYMEYQQRLPGIFSSLQKLCC